MTGHYQFDAYEAFQGLRERYTDFLLEHFGVPPGHLARELREHWGAEGADPFRLVAPLLVEGTFPFRPGVVVRDLMSPTPPVQDPARPLHPRTVELLERAGFREPLYEHQVHAIRAGSRGNTVVLSAGTGSGKTEAFLIPVIDRLFWAHERGEDDLSRPGVRAVVVYPLNALVNNQVERVRRLLDSQTRITFAYYTSRLKENFSKASSIYLARGQKPPACQIVDRQTLRGLDGGEGRAAGPPHILITNFSMLEYMLIRAADRTVFAPEYLFHRGRPRLSAIVLDEAHVYAGSQAAEIHMLLRRAALRFGTQLADVQGFATSATLSRSETPEVEREILMRFGGEMFQTDASRITALTGQRHLPDETGTPLGSSRLPQPAELPPGPLVAPELRTLVYDSEGAPTALLRDSRLAKLALDACITLGLTTPEDAPFPPPDAPAEVLHRVLGTCLPIIKLRTWLLKATLPTIDDVASFLYGDGAPSNARRRAVDAVLRLASLARRDAKHLPLIPTRMHAMLRAPAGVWFEPQPLAAESGPPVVGGEITSGRLHSSGGTGESGQPPRLPLRICTTCGASYLEVWRCDDPFGGFSVAATASEGAARALVLLDPEGPDTLPDELGGARAHVLAAEAVSRRGRDLRVHCPGCHDDRARARLLEMSPKTALGALVDAVYPHLNEHPRAADPGVDLPGGGRRILSFSDSRQGTARVAVEVEDTHDIGIVRRMIWDALRVRCEPVTVRDLIRDDLIGHPLLRRRAAAADLADGHLEELALVSVYQELARLPANAINLETLGLVEVRYPRLPPPPPGFGLELQEWTAFLSIVLDDARRRGAVALPPRGPDGDHRLHDLVRRNLLGKQLVFASSTPDAGGTNEEDDDNERQAHVALVPPHPYREQSRLVSFATRVASVCGAVDPVELLRAAWDALCSVAKPPINWLKLANGALSIHFERLELLAHDAPPLIRPASRRLHFRCVRGIVPERLDAAATTRESDVARPLTADEVAAWRARHAVQRVVREDPLALWSVEHTAQIETDDLEEQEARFRRGERNLLASSTTMEMGVDLGGLTFVLMTNVPPSASNYWQRAGRAGRRADGSSMALTLALPRPHDQRVFGDLRGFLLGPVVPPSVRLNTVPLVRRHLHAFLLAAFLEEVVQPTARGNPMDAFGNVGAFMIDAARDFHVRPEAVVRLGIDLGEPLARAFARWLNSLDAAGATATLVLTLVKGSGIEGSSPREVGAAAKGLFEAAHKIASDDLDVILQQRAAEYQRGDGVRDPAYLRALEHQEKDLRGEHVIAFLARTGFLPRFGFPVDVVRLETQWHEKRRERESDSSATPELRMERALDIALGEYAPGSEVIAAKRVHKVAGLIRNWMSDDRGVVQRHFFFECRRCGFVYSGLAQPGACTVCSHPTQTMDTFVKDAQAAKKQQRKAPPTADVDDLGPSPIREYLRPSSFAVKLNHAPRRLGGEVDRMPPSRVVLAGTGAPVSAMLPEAISVGFTAETHMFVRSEGNLPHPRAQTGYGYAICQHCGLAVPENDWGRTLAPWLRSHARLRGSKPCSAEPHNFWRHAILGTAGTVDVFRVRLHKEFAPRVNELEEEAFYITLAICLQQVAAERLHVDARTLKPTIGAWNDGKHHREAAIYDSSCSGVLAPLECDGLKVLQGVVELLDRRTDADFIGFDSQFFAMQGQLRVDLVRAHFLLPHIRTALEVV